MKTMPAYCTFYIVRHGETEWNIQGLIQGHVDSPLTKAGIKQAKDLAGELKDIHFDRVYASDLLRAKRTAEIITLERKLHVETAKHLRERKFGSFEGKPVEQLWALDRLTKELSHDEMFRHKVEEDAESDEEIATRLITFLREVAVAHPRKTILIVSHGGTMRAFFIHLGLMSYAIPAKGSVSNLAYAKVLSDGVDFVVKETKGIVTLKPSTSTP